MQSDNPVVEHVLLSIIIPSYNVTHKLQNCLDSLDALRLAVPSTEAVFVDDASTDDTYSRLLEFAASRPWVNVSRLPSNSGSPSAPRNRGMDLARGKYVWFQDPDDSILVDGAVAAITVAEEGDFDVVRGPLIRVDNSTRKVMNQLNDWADSWDIHHKRVEITRRQTANIMGPIRRDLLESTGVRWNEDVRLGEDILFFSPLLLNTESIGYTNSPLFLYDARRFAGHSSSTQRYGNRDLADHIFVWSTVYDLFSRAGIDYWEIRGQVALGTALNALLYYCWEEISYSNFMRLHEILDRHSAIVSRYKLRPRLLPILEAALHGDYEEFCRSSKLRLVVAGDDLKFISDGLKLLRRVFEIRVDKWQGHTQHDNVRSQKLIEWADIIHCEWCLGNAVWYSHNKRPDQIMIVRGHRFEVSRNFGRDMKHSSIDVFQGVALPMLEDFANTFELERSKLALVHNYIRDMPVDTSSFEANRFRLSMIGAIPARKGLHRGLEVLRRLRTIDSRYTLTLYGKRPSELPWVGNDSKERAYFAACDDYIREHGLDDAVEWAGWVDTSLALSNTGFLLSVSDHEGSHVSVAEALGHGVIAWMLPWRGADYVYPDEYVCPDTDSIANRVLECSSLDVYSRVVADGMEHVRTSYSLQTFVDQYIALVRQKIE